MTLTPQGSLFLPQRWFYTPFPLAKVIPAPPNRCSRRFRWTELRSGKDSAEQLLIFPLHLLEDLNEAQNCRPFAFPMSARKCLFPTLPCTLVPWYPRHPGSKPRTGVRLHMMWMSTLFPSTLQQRNKGPDGAVVTSSPRDRKRLMAWLGDPKITSKSEKTIGASISIKNKIGPKVTPFRRFCPI